MPSIGRWENSACIQDSPELRMVLSLIRFLLPSWVQPDVSFRGVAITQHPCTAGNQIGSAENLEDWPGHNQLRHVPELRFSYEEEASPEGFFVPYVWTLVFSHTTIPWRPQVRI